MKRTFNIIMMAALVAAVSCQKNETNFSEKEESQVVLYANESSSKTILSSDFKVSWAEGDALTVFNAEAGSSTYSDNCRFTISETATGKFVKDADDKALVTECASYDWYVCYPYMQYGSNPGGTKGYTVALAPMQVGYNNNNHVAGNDIIAGKALAVADGTAPNVGLHHVGTLLKFTVVNNSGKASSITGLTLNASAGGSYITGSFTMNWGAEGVNPSLDATQMGSSKSFTCALSVVQNNGTTEVPDYQPIETTIENGESVDLYMVVAPFTIPAGKSLNLTVTGSAGTATLTKTFSEETKFAAGTYNTATLPYEPINIVFTETFGANTVATKDVPSYGKAGLTTADEADKAKYAYSVTGNASIAAGTNTNKINNPNYYGTVIEGAAVKLPATSATTANSGLYIKGIKVKANTTYIFKYNKSKGSLKDTGEYNTTTVFKYKDNTVDSWNTVNSTTEVGTITQEFTTGDYTVLDIGVEATDRNPAGTITYYPALDLFQLIEK